MQLEKEATFKNWVEAYSDLLYHHAIKKGFDTDGAKDLVQETYLAAWRNIEKYNGEASVKNWLFVILKNKITDHFRKPSTKAQMESIEQDHNGNLFFDEDDHWKQGMYPKNWKVQFSNALELKEFYKIFDGCGKKLKSIQNSVFVMKYVEGLDSDEICKELEITSANFWVLIHRAKVQLRACLEKNWMKQ